MSAPSFGQSVDRIVAFGDSYADDGNVFRMFGARPPAMYPKGRFSNGTNFIDTIGELLDVPIVNFALGGAVTAGFDTQYRAFLAGGGPAAFPRVEGRLRPTDLVVISIGGNDARAYAKSLGASPSAGEVARAVERAPAAALASVANAAEGVEALVKAGARNIMFVGGDVGRLPEFNGTRRAAAGTAFSSSYNDGVRAMLAAYERRGIQSRYVNLDDIHQRVEAEPSAYGLVGAGACPADCLRNPKLADKYLFYVDRVHPSSAGFAIIGRYAVEQMRAGRSGGGGKAL
jgi:phospholipase/lecithinase/hemolysin